MQLSREDPPFSGDLAPCPEPHLPEMYIPWPVDNARQHNPCDTIPAANIPLPPLQQRSYPLMELTSRVYGSHVRLSDHCWHSQSGDPFVPHQNPVVIESRVLSSARAIILDYVPDGLLALPPVDYDHECLGAVGKLPNASLSLQQDILVSQQQPMPAAPAYAVLEGVSPPPCSDPGLHSDSTPSTQSFRPGSSSTVVQTSITVAKPTFPVPVRKRGQSSSFQDEVPRIDLRRVGGARAGQSLSARVPRTSRTEKKIG